MSIQFDENDFDQNPSKKKRKLPKEKVWVSNNDPELRDPEVLTKKDVKRIKDEKWEEKHIPKPNKRERKIQQKITDLEKKKFTTPLTKKEEKKLKKLKKKYKKLYDYRHRDFSSNHNLFKGCVITLVALCVIVVVLVGVLYSTFVQPTLGLTFTEFTKVLGGLYRADDKTITQTFDAEKDSQYFLDSLQSALLLDTDLTVRDILALLPANEGGTGDNNATVNDLLDLAADDGSGGAQDGFTTGNEHLDSILAEAKFDVSSLKDYNGGKRMWEINDKHIAALMQQVVLIADEIPTLQDALSSFNVSIKDVVAIRQCLLTKNSNSETTLKLTIELKVADLAAAAITSLASGENGSSEMDMLVQLKPLIKAILPKKVYVNLITTPEVDKAPTFGINSIDDQYVKKIMSAADANGNIENTLNGIGTTICNVFAKVTELTGTGGFVLAPSEGTTAAGTIKIDALQMLMSAMKVDTVSSEDFLLMMKHLHSVDFKYDSVDDYLSNNSGLQNISDEVTFNNNMKSLFGAYGVVVDTNITPDNFLETIEDLPNILNLTAPSANGKYLYETTNSELKEFAKLSDADLALVMRKIIGNEFANYGLDLHGLKMQKESMSILASFDISTMLEGQTQSLGILQTLIGSVFPKTLIVKIDVPYKKNANGISCNLVFNYVQGQDVTAASDKMLESLAGLMAAVGGGNSFDKNALLQQFDEAIYPAIDNISSSTGGLHIEFTEGRIQLPTIYEVVQTQLNAGLTADQIQQTLKGYYTYDENIVNNGNLVNKVEAVSLSRFSGDLEAKFFLNSGVIDDNNPLQSLMNINGQLNGEGVAALLDLPKFKTYKDAAANKNITITTLELAKLISADGILDAFDIGFYNNFEFVDMLVRDNVLTLVIAGKLNSAAQPGGGLKLENVAAPNLVINASVTLQAAEGTNYYPASVTINKTSAADINNLMKIIEALAGSGDINVDTIQKSVGETIFNAFNRFDEQGMGLIAGEAVVDTPVGGRTDGFTSTNIYKLVAKKTNGSGYKDGDDELLKNVIYKLNNASDKMSEVAAPYGPTADKENNTFTVGDKTYDLNASLGKPVYDQLIGQILSRETDDSQLSVIKFAMATGASQRLKALRDNLGLSTIATDAFLSGCTDGVLFMQYVIPGAKLGGNSLVEAIMPANIYGGAFVDLSNSDNIKLFVNNLTQAELDFIGGFINGEGNQGSTSIQASLQGQLDGALQHEISINISGVVIPFTIKEILQYFKVEDIAASDDYYNYCYGELKMANA